MSGIHVLVLIVEVLVCAALLASYFGYYIKGAWSFLWTAIVFSAVALGASIFKYAKAVAPEDNEHG